MAGPLFSISINDRDGLRRAINVVPNKFPRNTGRELFKIANEYKNNVVNAMNSTPRLINVSYKRGRNVHHPSAPYFPPARDTNELVDKMRVERYFEWRSFGAIFYIKGAPYAPILEDGSADGTLKPRPVYENELNKMRVQDRILSKFARDFKR